MRARAVLAALLAVGLCLAMSPAVSAAQDKKRKSQRDLVTRDEIMESAQREHDLYSALRSLRPRFLQPPTGIRSLGNSMQAATAVILDGKPMGDLETLRTITASTVEEVRYLEPSKAGTEYGNVANGGAVVVKLYKAPKVTKEPADSAKPTTR
jgi:hypothetical protein